MANQSSLLGYSIFDFLTRIIPGLVVVIPVAISYLTMGPRFDIGYQPVLIGLAILGLIIGELIDLTRSAFFRVPLPFKQVLYRYTGQKETLSWFDRVDLRLQSMIPDWLKPDFFQEGVGRGTVFDESSSDFREVYEEHFDLDFDVASTRTLYSALLSYMDQRMSANTQRYYMLRIFAQNLMFAVIFTGLASLFLIVFSFGSTLTVFIAAVTIVLLIAIFEIGMIISPVAYPFVDRLLVDYYVDRLEHRSG